MSDPQLSIRSAKARALARKYAKEDRRSITQVVEISLELYGERRAAKKRETADAFFDRLVRENHIEGEADIDLDAIIRANRKADRPVEF